MKWEERFEQSFPNLEINMAVTDKLTGEKIKLEGLDVILLKDFISSEIAEARDDVIRKFATGEFVKTPLADKLVAEAKRELLKEIKDPKDGEKDKRIAD